MSPIRPRTDPEITAHFAEKTSIARYPRWRIWPENQLDMIEVLLAGHDRQECSKSLWPSTLTLVRRDSPLRVVRTSALLPLQPQTRAAFVPRLLEGHSGRLPV